MIHELSIVITTFNRKDLLEECVDSILKQTYKDFEIIIVDNYSDYDFVKFIQSFNDKRIRYYQNSNNGIIAVNRNFGINKAKGNYIAFCDDDDIWCKDKLELQIDKIKKHNFDLVFTNMKLFKNDVSNIIKVQKSRPVSSFSKLLKCNEINTSSVIVKKIKELHFPEDSILVGCEDYALWLNLSLEGCSIGLIEEPLVYYRLGENASKDLAINKHLKMICIFIGLKLSNPNLKVLFQVTKHLLVYIVKKVASKLKLYR
tara:strand:+ start:52 stop:825 length:774 start_codon:yes stop_codon:yes gene_type:complete